MSNAEYVFMEDMTHSAAVLDMMHRLYAEDTLSIPPFTDGHSRRLISPDRSSMKR